MHRTFAFLLALTAAACSAPAPATSTVAHLQNANAPAAAPPEDPIADADDLHGAFYEATEVTAAHAGAMVFSDTRITFSSGIQLFVTQMRTVSVNAPRNSQHASFAAVKPGESDRLADIRRIDHIETANGARALCDPAARPTYVAVLYQQPIRSVSLIVFTGADAPGPAAIDSQVCAVYAYAANDELL